MIRNTVVNTISYFYPLGNTPAVSLTQDLPYGKDADILLLGCGDARNVLFTCFADSCRRLDITCCDIEPAIIARNILLYTLSVDDVNNIKFDEIWNLYYHWKLDEKSLYILEDQVGKLLCLSATLSKWRLSVYGNTFRFCDERTLVRVRKFWSDCSSRELSKVQKSRRNVLWQSKIKKAQEMRQDKMSGGATFEGFRSGAPTGLSAVRDFQDVAERWWKEGVTSSCKELNRKPSELNPAFFSTVNENVTLHYGTDPLLGFPLATAYVPLSSNSSFFVRRSGASSAEYLTACAQKQFRKWVEAFQKNAVKGLVLRFCVADALTFSLTLKNAVLQRDGRLTANLYCDNWTAEPIILDRDEYATKKQAGPRRFDIVDTSNLVDHLGPLNVMPPCAALLKYESFSTLYTEVLVQVDSTERERLTGLLGGDFRTIALLLGLSPCEAWTNATNSLEDDSLLRNLYRESDKRRLGGSTQTRSRLRWKRTYQSNENELLTTVHFKALQAAQLLVALYNHMFSYQNIFPLKRPDIKDVLKRSNPHYNGASFALLIVALRETIVTDWSKCLDLMHQQIYSGFSQSPIGANYAQELALYMHMLRLDDKLQPINRNAIEEAKLAPFFEPWSEIPTYVCLTIRVPRYKLRPFTAKVATEIGTPALKCDVESGDITSNPWSNSFASVQVAFGNPQLTISNGIPILQIDDDRTGWLGQSDMFASTFVPTWMILQPHENIPIMKCGLLTTPQSTLAFVGALGFTLSIFSAQIMSENVTISRYMPEMSNFPAFTAEGQVPRPQSPLTTTVTFSQDNMTITGITTRINFTSETEKSTLRDRSVPVKVHFLDFFRAFVNIGDQIDARAEFPFPIDKFRRKVRIARKSSYIEVEAPVWDPLMDSTALFIFPVMLPRLSSGEAFTPVPWTATRVDLNALPVIDVVPTKAYEWLKSHASMMFSLREQRIREVSAGGHASQLTVPNVRVEMKELLSSMLMSYTSLKSKAANVFGLSKELGDIKIILLPSCCRLDLVNRTVVLDVAVIPLTNLMMTNNKVLTFCHDFTSQGLFQIKVTDEELRSWKSILPALVERCRMWDHTSSCEYANKGEVPLSEGLEDGHSPLCSCGVGKFPADYLKDLKINNIDYLLKHHATRAAISPFFAVPYVEDCFTLGPTPNASPGSKSPASSTKIGCGKCGKMEKMGSDVGGEKLMVCSRCEQMRYCSKDCQKADWQNHKKVCPRPPKSL